MSAEARRFLGVPIRDGHVEKLFCGRDGRSLCAASLVFAEIISAYRSGDGKDAASLGGQ